MVFSGVGALVMRRRARAVLEFHVKVVLIAQLLIGGERPQVLVAHALERIADGARRLHRGHEAREAVLRGRVTLGVRGEGANRVLRGEGEGDGRERRREI